MPDGQDETPATAVASQRPRMRWIDGAKGIGIILVVYGHAARAIYPGVTGPAWEQIADRVIYAFHMPLFFVVAGLFVWPSLARGRNRFVTDKLVTIVYPYFLWSLIEGGLEVAFTPEVNTPISLTDLAMIPVEPIEQFWFLYALALCLLLALLCYPRRFAVAAVAVAGVAVVSVHGSASMVLRTLLFFPCVATGILIAAPIIALGRSPRRAGAVLVATSAVFAAGMLAGWTGVIADLVLALAGSGAALAVAALVDRGAVGTTLALFGRASLAIYVMHTIFSAGLRIGVHVLGIAAPPPSLVAATMVVGIAGPLAVWLVAERYGLSTLLGLGRETRARGPGRGLFDGENRRNVVEPAGQR